MRLTIASLVVVMCCSATASAQQSDAAHSKFVAPPSVNDPPHPAPKQTKAAPAPKAKASPLPAANGSPLQQPPDHIADADKPQMEVLACEQRADQLQARVIELEQENRELRRAGVTARAKAISDRYMLTPDTAIKPDGTIIRGGGKR